MNSLPDLVLFEIFSSFTLDEKFKILRPICRRWRSLLNIKNLKRLFVYENEISFKRNWGSYDDPIKINEMIKFKLFIKLLENEYLRNIKGICFFSIPRWKFDILPKAGLFLTMNINLLESKKMQAEISKVCEIAHFEKNLLLKFFKQLEQIFILDDRMESNLRLESIGDLFTKELHLPELRNLSFTRMLNSSNIFINAPNLEKLTFTICYNLKINLSNLENIKLIKCDELQNNLFQKKKFNNLEILICSIIDYNFDLNNYPKLKKIELWPKKDELHLLELLRKQKIELERNELEIYVLGFKDAYDLYLENRFSSLTFDHKDAKRLREYLIKQEKKKLNKSHYDWESNVYITNSLCKLNKISNYFLKMHVRYLSVCKKNQVNPKLLIRFLKDINGVDELEVNCSYEQEFYDQLPSIKYIPILEINAKLDFINHNFINHFKFSTLFRFKYKNHFPIDTVHKILKEVEVNKFEIYHKSFKLTLEYLFEKKFALLFIPNQYDSYQFSKSFKSVDEAFLFLRNYEEIKNVFVFCNNFN